MDVVMDLTARAVAFITLAQDISYSVQPQENKGGLEPVALLDDPADLKDQLLQARGQEKFQERIIELTGINGLSPARGLLAQPLKLLWKRIRPGEGEKAAPPPVLPAAFDTWLQQTESLLWWLNQRGAVLYPKLCYSHLPPQVQQDQEISPEPAFVHVDPYPAPQQWREAIRHVLYANPKDRKELAIALNYLPALVELVHKSKRTSALEREKLRKEWPTDPGVLATLEDDGLLYSQLKEQQLPLPFEIVYQQELKEITKKRGYRQQPAEVDSRDPLEQAEALELRALAFSGGGIRSATFNLGILQGLAKANLLPRIDYLSTVSGGGYLGAWFTAWIRRDGLLLKVQDRLNPEKSSDPRGEEVRPIRWLRMFSNYLAPNKNIMSADSWTMGLTWIRNTLLNQVIILLLLCAVVSLGFFLYLAWNGQAGIGKVSGPAGLVVVSLHLVVGGLLAGWGMRAYHPEPISPNPNNPRILPFITRGLLGLGLVLAYLVSSWFFSLAHHQDLDTVSDRMISLVPVALVGAVTLLLVAGLGGYFECLPRNKQGLKAGPVILVIVSSLLSAAFGALLLALAWELMQYLAWSSRMSFSWRYLPEKYQFKQLLDTREFYERLAFIVGVPLILEVLSLTVVMRMALLGRYFPDARREWWGRIGGLVHRCMLGWILLSGIGLLGGKLLEAAQTHLLAVAGGWVALVGLAVRLAYSAGTPAQESTPKRTMAMKGQDLLVRIAPYLFMVGLFIIAAGIMYRVLDLHWIAPRTPENPYSLGWAFVVTVIFTLLSFGLAWRVGVNEFSMHHFYRNRLMRGYLAATRRRTEREKTANTFTGFDEADDLKLCLLRKEKGYDGPYPIINVTLNASQVTDLERQDRQGESFVFTPLFCGFDISPTRPAEPRSHRSYEYGYRATENYAYKPKVKPNGEEEPGGPGMSTAMAISGAAANPNQGAHSSPATAFLMTVFNARLGWWMGNPRGVEWQRSDPRSGFAYLIYDLLGRTSTARDYVCLSDGGHFDNMGLYELIRRRVRFIVLGDAEQDKLFTCEGLANAVRRCRVDFGVEIVIDVTRITTRDEKTAQSACHCALGTIWYPGDAEGKPSGTLVYLKTSLTGDEPVDVREYAAGNLDFPHQSTADQFFSEAQFESYRRLGLHVIETALADPKVRQGF